MNKVTKTINGETYTSGDFLVVEDPNSPDTWHLPVKRHGKPDHDHMGKAYAALTKGFMGNKYQGPNKQHALAKLRSLYKSAGMEWPGNTQESLVEQIENPEITSPIIDESTNPILAKVSGRWAKVNSLSKNNNYYPRETIAKVIEKANKRIENPNAAPITILETHDDANHDSFRSILGKITRVYLDGDIAKYDGEIANTATGRDYVNLIRGGFACGSSLRAEKNSALVEAAQYKGKKVRRVLEFELGGIDCTKRPAFGEYGKFDTVTLFESVEDKDVKDEDEKEDEDEANNDADKEDDEEEDEKSNSSKIKESLQAGAKNYANWWYDAVTALCESGAIVQGELEAYCKDMMPLIRKGYSEGAKFDERDVAAFAKQDYAGKFDTFPIVSKRHVKLMESLLKYSEDPKLVQTIAQAISTRKGINLQESTSKSKELLSMTTDELNKIVQQQIQEALKNDTTTFENNSAPNVEVTESHMRLRHRDHLRTAHDLTAHVCGYKCAGKGHKMLGESLGVLDDTPFEASDGDHLDIDSYASAALAHDHIASALGMSCAPQNRVTPPKLGADENPKQNNQPPVREGATATPTSGQSYTDYKDVGGESMSVTSEDLQNLIQESITGTTQRFDKQMEGVIGVIKTLAESVKSTNNSLNELKQSLEDAERQNWRKVPQRQTAVSENRDAAPKAALTESSQVNDNDDVEDFAAFLKNKDIDPQLRLHKMAQVLGPALRGQR